jgi:hypothetical protein
MQPLLVACSMVWTLCAPFFVEATLTAGLLKLFLSISCWLSIAWPPQVTAGARVDALQRDTAALTSQNVTLSAQLAEARGAAQSATGAAADARSKVVEVTEALGTLRCVCGATYKAACTGCMSVAVSCALVCSYCVSFGLVEHFGCSTSLPTCSCLSCT